MNTEALRHMAKLLRELHADGTLCGLVGITTARRRRREAII